MEIFPGLDMLQFERWLCDGKLSASLRFTINQLCLKTYTCNISEGICFLSTEKTNH